MIAELEEKIKSAIEIHGVSESVIMMGEKSNVYPYLSKSNLYVCTSQSESYPIAINEAKVMGVPIVSNRFPSVAESIIDGKDGRVTDLDCMAESIADMIEHPMTVKAYEPNNEDILNSF